MSSGFSVYLNNSILNKILRGTDFATPTKYLALFKSDAGLANNVTASRQEVSGNGYARIAISNTVFSAAANSTSSNTVVLQFPTFTDTVGTVTHVAIMDNATVGSGNVLSFGQLLNPNTGEPMPKPTFPGDTLTARVGALTIKILNSLI